jgi:hypothetical protein
MSSLHEEIDLSIRIWNYAQAPGEYKQLSSTDWHKAFVARRPKPQFAGAYPGLPSNLWDILTDGEFMDGYEHHERYEVDNYIVVIWGWLA